MARKASLSVGDLFRRIWAPEAISLVSAAMLVMHVVQDGFAWTPRIMAMIAMIALAQLWTVAAVLSLAKAQAAKPGSDDGDG